MSRKLVFITFPIILLVGIYFMGPEPDQPLWRKDMPSVPQNPDSLVSYVEASEARHHVKTDNESRIVWMDSLRSKTEYSVVYLHGFSASQGEGDPIHLQFAITFGCNLYLPRLSDHGIDTVDQLLYYTPDRSWASAKEALAIGKAIGNKVILVSTSTGGSLALALAAEFPDDVYALINMSPNIAINDPMAWIANNPWGLQMARLIKKGNYNITKPTPGADTLLDYRYWNHKYRLEAVCQLEELLESKMNKQTFEKVKAPSLTLYYYKNEREQDPQVKVSAMLEMNQQLSTPDSLKDIIPIPNAGGHVLGSYIVSKDVDDVWNKIWKFATEKLRMKAIEAPAVIK